MPENKVPENSVPENKATRSVKITNSEGLHLRAARSVADTVRRFESQVCLVKDGERVEATEVLQMLSLGVAQGEGSKTGELKAQFDIVIGVTPEDTSKDINRNRDGLPVERQ